MVELSPRILTSEEKATATKEIKLNDPGIHKITKAEFLVVDEAWKLYSARPKEGTLDSSDSLLRRPHFLHIVVVVEINT